MHVLIYKYSFSYSSLSEIEYHGTQGPLYVSDINFEPMDSVFVNAAEEMGFKKTDVTGEFQEGITFNKLLNHEYMYHKYT